jgi:Resolvase, N terminal domain
MRIAKESTKTTTAIASRRNPINPRHAINHQTLSARFQVGSSSCIVFPVPERWHYAEVDKCILDLYGVIFFETANSEPFPADALFHYRATYLKSDDPFGLEGSVKGFVPHLKSTVGQSLEAQIQQLTEDGCDRIFQEKISGAKTDRPQLTRLLPSLQPSDTLVVTRLDRLARSTLDLLNIVKATALRKLISYRWLSHGPTLRLAS